MAATPEHIIFKVVVVGTVEGEHPAEAKREIVAAIEEVKKSLEAKGNYIILGLTYQTGEDKNKAANDGAVSGS